MACANDAPPDLLVVGRAPTEAELISSAADGRLRFRDKAGEEQMTTAEELVRWSTPSPARSADEMHLADGSRIALAPSWTSAGSLKLDADSFTAKTSMFGLLQAPRSPLRAVFWRLPPDDSRRQEVIDQLLKAESGNADAVQLANGDVLFGRLIGIHPQPDAGADANGSALVFDAAIGRVELPLERIRGLRLSATGGALTTQQHEQPAFVLWVGLSDGSLIAAHSVTTNADELVVTSLSAGELRGEDIRAVASLQAYGGRAVYLSDLEPADYRHEPYLDLEWPLGRDRNVLGGVPIVGERRFLKTVAMHSAARATYKLDGTYDRFAASIAVDDAADGGGSVAFRVYLRKGDFWQTAYASPVVRRGDPPRHVAVDLTDARELRLVVDYADRGDERDYAHWLDARLEQGP